MKTNVIFSESTFFVDFQDLIFVKLIQYDLILNGCGKKYMLAHYKQKEDKKKGNHAHQSVMMTFVFRYFLILLYAFCAQFVEPELPVRGAGDGEQPVRELVPRQHEPHPHVHARLHPQRHH
jgi:hypothetical protein